MANRADWLIHSENLNLNPQRGSQPYSKVLPGPEAGTFRRPAHVPARRANPGGRALPQHQTERHQGFRNDLRGRVQSVGSGSALVTDVFETTARALDKTGYVGGRDDDREFTALRRPGPASGKASSEDSQTKISSTS